ncbi:putative bifunctional diguanylate cyclase/phosphodiesterase [Hydrogenimonas sp.]
MNSIARLRERIGRLFSEVSSPEDTLHLFLREHLLVTLCKRVPVTMTAIILLATAVLILFWPFENPYVIGGWYGAVLLLALFRISKTWNRCGDAQKPLQTRYRNFRVEALLMAVLWGVAAFFFYPSGELAYEMLLAIFIIVLSSASAVNLAIDRRIAELYIYLLLLPLALRFVMVGDTLHMVMFAAVSAYTALLHMSLRQLGSVLAKGIRQHGELGELQERLKMVLDQTPTGIFYYDTSFRVVDCNRTLSRLLDAPKERIVGLDLMQMKDAKIRELLRRTIEEGVTLRYDGPYTSLLSGKKIWVSATVAPLLDGEGALVGAIGVLEDKTLEHEALEKAEFLAYHDALTSLPNRKLLGDRFDSQIAQAGRKKYFSALLFLDLDRFKHINDTYGHKIGDELLKETARRLLKILRKSDTVCRLGGDEFIIFLPMISEDLTKSVNETLYVSQKIHKALAQTFEIEKHQLFVSTSIGAVMIGTRGETLDEVLRCADIAMYHAKKLGRGVTSFYEEYMDEQIKTTIQMEKDLRHALDREELRLFFQPIVEIETQEIVGAEVLLRWEHPSGIMVLPAEFIPVAEESQMIHQIGRWVIAEACRKIEAWREKGHRLPGYLSINLSPKQLRYNGFFEQAMELVTKSGVDPGRIKFEITESVLIEESERTKELIDRFKMAGIGFMIDDFGTGYSSLSYLKRFEFETIKIDKSFIRDILVDEEDVTLVKAILDIAKQFGYGVIAEGVENSQQRKRLNELGGAICYQGYLYSRPLDEAAFLELMERV